MSTAELFSAMKVHPEYWMCWEIERSIVGISGT